MNLPLSKRVNLLVRLGEYINNSENEEWEHIKHSAFLHNSWFIPEFVNQATTAIGKFFLQKNKLEAWISNYNIPDIIDPPKKIGVVMAGNIPAVGFHDFLCCFLSGHHIILKLSSKDKVLVSHFIQKLVEWEPAAEAYFSISEMLKGCDAYIATGSNNSARYFHQYFDKYPYIIRQNRTAVAVLDGTESIEELNALADDVFMYFGRGCRNVTKIFVPEEYDFEPLLNAMKKYDYFNEYHHYKNNFDYQLSLLLLNKSYYMSNGVVLLHQHESVFSAVSVLHYDFYKEKDGLLASLADNNDLQCVVSHGSIPFGKAQTPELEDYADDVDTMAFLTSL